MPTRLVGAALALTPTTPAPRHGTGWHLTPTGTDVRIRGLAAVGRRTAWAAGSQGTVLRTIATASP